MFFMHCSPTYPAIETPHVHTAFPSRRLTRTLSKSLGSPTATLSISFWVGVARGSGPGCDWGLDFRSSTSFSCCRCLIVKRL